MSALRPVSALLALSMLLLACPGPMPQEPADGGEVTPPPPSDGGQPRDPPPDAGSTPLFTVGGPLVIDTGTSTPAAFKVGVLWFRSIESATPERPAGAVTGSSTFNNPWPSRWKLELFDAPPVAARAEFTTPGGGGGFRSFGQLVLFRDVDGDGLLTVRADGSSSDEVIGSSAGVMPFDVDGPGRRMLLVWRSGPLGSDEAIYQPGYNLIDLDEPRATPVVVPPSTDVTLTVTKDPRHALTFCEAAYALEPAEYACGQLLYRTPRVMAVATSSGGVVLAGVHVYSGARAIGDAVVRLNGTILPSDGENGYLLIELTPSIIRFGMNNLRVEAPGLEPVSIEVVLPRAAAFTTPAEQAELLVKEPFTVTWLDAEGANTFDVSVTAESGLGDFVTSRVRQATLTAPETAGPAVVRITAIAERPQGRHTAKCHIEAERAVTLVAP